MRFASISIAILFVSALGSAGSAAPVLERVVMVSRHGVRSPTRRVEVLALLAKRGWPAWPVPPGEMTAHGAKNLALMADFLRDTYQTEKVLPAQGCPAQGALAVWSDAADHRTRQSGDIFADGFAPGCGVKARHAPDGTADPLFDAQKSGACPIGLIGTGKALLSIARQDKASVTDQHALDILQGILAPDACKPGGKGLCLVPEGTSPARTGATLALASPIVEAIYLEYVQGFPPNDVGWGKAADAATIAAIMPVHDGAMDVLRRTPELAARRGAVMARTILALLQERPPPAGAPPLASGAKVVMMAGHDSNLLYMAALMGLDWRLPHQPSRTPPDATLAFEVWREPASGRRTARVVLYAQTLSQLREATVLDDAHRPDVVPITPEACAKAGPDGCEVGVLVADVERRLGSICKK